MKDKLKNEGKLLAVSLFVGVLLAVGAAAYTYVYSAAAQRDIARNVIRLHVVANSNSPRDQALKEHVRTEVLAEFAGVLFESYNMEETRANVAGGLPAIQAHAENAVRRAGFGYPVTAAVSTVFFPTRFYGGMSFPPGEYEAVQIVIGDGAGGNWWCLMFPPLCYVDMAASADGRRRLAESVSEEGFRLLTHRETDASHVAVRFRIVEWWQNRRQPAPQAPHRQIVQG